VSEENSKKMETETPNVSGPEPKESPQEIRYIDLNLINVPKERVTSVWDAEIEAEFEESIKAKGILKPLDLMEVEGTLWLTDGLHRLLIAEKLGISRVPAIIKKGSLEDLLIENLISNRQRGKSNPAQEAEVLAYLVHNRGFPLENASKQLGLSSDWARKLLKISTLPDEIKDYLKRGEIPVTGAFYIADLPSASDQISVARDAAKWGYNAYQIKARVTQKLCPDYTPEQGDTTFTQNGKPTRIPIRCRFCGDELPDVGKQYIWICPECEELAADLIKDYKAALADATRNNPPSPPENPPKPPEK
jgi:ParB family chromosome partitioning protein